MPINAKGSLIFLVIVSFIFTTKIVVAQDNLTVREKFKLNLQKAVETVTAEFRRDLSSLQSRTAAFSEIIGENKAILEEMASKPDTAPGMIASILTGDFSVLGLEPIPDREEGRQIIDGKLVGVVNILSGTYIARLKSSIDFLSTEIATANRQIDDDQFQLSRNLVPTSRDTFDFTTMIRSDYEKRFQANKALVENLKVEREQKKLLMLAALREAGISLKSPAQYDALMNSVSGQEDIRIFSAAQTITGYLEIKGQRLAINPSDMAIAEDYYAERTLLIRVLMIMHQTYLDRVQEEFKPNLKQVITDSNKKIQDTKQSLSRNKESLSENERLMGERTISLLENQVAVARSYIAFLDSNMDRVEESLEGLEARYSVSENTYFSIQQAGALQNQILSADFLGTVINFDIPDMVVSDVSALEQDLQDLNLEIKNRQ